MNVLVWLKNIKNTNWFRFTLSLQKITAYLPVILVPWIISPFSADAFYIEKIFVILFFSSISLFCSGIKTLLSKDKILGYEFTISRQWIYVGLILFVALISAIFSVNANQSMWGSGFLLLAASSLWLITIAQVFDRQLFLKSFVLGTTILAVINFIVVITRFSGSGFWSFVSSENFSASGNISSMLFLIFISIVAILFLVRDSKNYFLTLSLFLLVMVYVLFAWFIFFIPFYIALGLLFVLFLREKTQKKEAYLHFLKVSLVLLAVFIGVFEIFLQKDVIQKHTDAGLNLIWQVTYHTGTDSPKNLILGEGENNFLYSYIKNKQNGVNTSPAWSQEYKNSPYSFAEILTSYGLLPFVLMFIFLILKLRKQNLKKLVLKNFFIIVIAGIFMIVFFFTEFSFVMVWGLFTLAAYFLTYEKVEFSLQVKGNKPYKSLTGSILVIFLGAITVPIMIFSLILLISSTLVGFGSQIGNADLVASGINLFSQYTTSYSTAISTYSHLTSDTDKTAFVPVVRNYARKMLEQNPKDLNAYENYLAALANVEPDNNSRALGLQIYSTLIKNLSGTHLPLLLGYVDLNISSQNYSLANYLCDVMLALRPDFDLAYYRKASISLLQADKTNAKNFAQLAKDHAESQQMKDAAIELLNNLSK